MLVSVRNPPTPRQNAAALNRRGPSHGQSPSTPHVHVGCLAPMSVILAGPNNKVVMAAPGRPLLAGPLPTSLPDGGTPDLSSIAGLMGWWDAGTPSGMLDSVGTPLTAFGAPVAAGAAKSGAGAALSAWHRAVAGASPPIATPRLSGLLGGLGLNMVVPPQLPQSGKQLPVMDPDQGLISA